MLVMCVCLTHLGQNAPTMHVHAVAFMVLSCLVISRGCEWSLVVGHGVYVCLPSYRQGVLIHLEITPVWKDHCLIVSLLLVYFLTSNDYFSAICHDLILP